MAGRRKVVSLKGAACQAFIEALAGVAPKTLEDSAERIVTFVHLSMTSGDMDAAKAIILLVGKEGVEAVAKGLTKKSSMELEKDGKYGCKGLL